MAFSNSSFFAGIGTAFAAIAVGFAGGAMITTRAVDQPNRLERIHAGTVGLANSATPKPSVASSDHGQQDSTKPPTQSAPPAAASAPARTEAATNLQAPPVPRTAEPPAVAKTDDRATAREDTTAAKNERASTRSADPRGAASRRRAERKSAGDHRFSEHRRRPDQDPRQPNLDAAANLVRQTPRDGAVDEIVERDPAPRFGNGRPRHFELFGEYDSPRLEPRLEERPRFGFFGD